MEYEPEAKTAGKIALGILIGIMLLFLIIKTFIAVGTGKIGVVTQFGRVTGRELSEGFSLVAPWQSVTQYDIKVQKEEVEAAAASKDLQDVKAALVLNFRVEAGKVSEIHRTIGRDYREKVIDPAIQEVFKASTAKYDATQLITDRASVKKDALDLLHERLVKFGIVVDDVSIVNFSFSDEFTKAIEQKQVAQQNAERAKFNLEASRTDSLAQEAQKSTLSPLLLQKLAIEKWSGVMPTYVGGGSVFNIPLTQ